MKYPNLVPEWQAVSAMEHHINVSGSQKNARFRVMDSLQEDAETLAETL
jgi:hypothetical protein